MLYDEPKINIFAPSHKTSKTINLENNFTEEVKKMTGNFGTNPIFDSSKSQRTVKEVFPCSISRLNSVCSEKSSEADSFPFEDHIN